MGECSIAHGVVEFLAVGEVAQEDKDVAGGEDEGIGQAVDVDGGSEREAWDRTREREPQSGCKEPTLPARKKRRQRGSLESG